MMLFSLISKNVEIRQKPGKKVVPSEEYSQLINLEDLQKEAKDDLQKIKEETLEECSIIKEEAKKAGFKEGMESLNLHIVKLDSIIKELESEYKEKLISLVLKAAKKIVGDELKINPEAIVSIVSQALKPVSQHHKIRIYVNKEDKAALEKEKNALKGIFDHLESLSILERNDIEKGGCIIETEAGIINAELETQWQAIEAAFKKFMKK